MIGDDDRANELLTRLLIVPNELTPELLALDPRSARLGDAARFRALAGTR